MNVQTAIYCRLSREDGDSIESSSITTQKEILVEHTKKMGWEIYDIYVDDGYSGGNFNRPAWQRLLRDIENQKIDVVITKDLSRLGRNYIESGYYTEEYFPNHKVRYIALNDNYDSMEGDNDLTPFKNIINQWYLKDISKKVKSAHENRMRKGKLPNGKIIPLFGYLHTDDNERILDPVSSKIVKRVFELYIQGLTSNQIKEKFLLEKVPTPSYFNYLHYNYNHDKWNNVNDIKKYDWNHKVINRIVTNRQYTGALELKKTQTISYKTHKRILSSDDEKYVFENRFPPIITKDIWEKASEIRNSRTRSNIPLEDNLFQNLVYCKNCFKTMSLIRNHKHNIDYYVCRRKDCTNHQRILMKTLNEVVKIEINLILDKIINNEKLILQCLNKIVNKRMDAFNESKDSEKKILINRINKLESLITKLFKNSDLPDSLFNKLLDNYTNELKLNQLKLDKLSTDKNAILVDENIKVDFIKYLHFLKEVPLSNQLIKAFIQKIVVHKENKTYKINILYRKIAFEIDK